jgi:hypothetical protein
LSGGFYRTTTALEVEATYANCPTYGTNKWCFAAITMDFNGANGNQKLYHGDLSTLAVEPSAYSLQTVGTGTRPSDASVDAFIGNSSNANVALGGALSIVAVFNRVLSLGEIQSWQFDPRMMAGCVGLWRLGDNGTGTQPDYSGNGNAGTVTSATQADNPPLRRPWRRRVIQSTPTAPTAYTVLSPTSDVADGGWLNEVATGTNLYASVDEVSASDADYIIGPLSASADTVKLGLASAGGTPGAGTVTLNCYCWILLEA